MARVRHDEDHTSELPFSPECAGAAFIRLSLPAKEVSMSLGRSRETEACGRYLVIADVPAPLSRGLLDDFRVDDGFGR